ncbi:hypothetical protein BCR35DRAFT_82804 [Leucosporidium creatinivorum]|uniref:BHLH domain-containing protein n=1 Tax=Leucosporidium creatinivorum TaxID=106004 RepID=A0A1Y2FEN9_9BASI|nr:hypothetical protein BCR35DRAFT_82804 [Leucosporidium creatinivorum]
MTLAQSFDGFTGLSPSSPSSHSPEHPQLSLFDDRAEDQDQFLLDDKPAPSNKKSNGRKGPGAADKRATHNAIERARRESLNGRFMTLAEALPSMAKVKRPSKSVIVQNALSFVYDAQVS